MPFTAYTDITEVARAHQIRIRRATFIAAEPAAGE